MSTDHTDSEWRLEPPVRATPVRRCPSPRSQHRDKNTDFIMTGFHQAEGIRYYVYQVQHEDGSVSESTVDADVRLLRKHGIALQELPLLCRRLLERQNSDASVRAVTFTEDLMKEQADQRAALKQAAQAKKKVYRRPRPSPFGRDHRGSC
jgi:hypothetical protein